MPTLEIAGWKASYQESGVGLPIVFIPGITEYKESFIYQIRGLSDRYRIVSYDVRPDIGGTDYDIKLLAQDLGRVLDNLRLPSAVIAGHCFGGLIAQQFAMENPDRTTALILISSYAKAFDRSQSKLLQTMSSGCLHAPESKMARLLQTLGFGKPPEYNDEEHMDWVAKQAAKTSGTTIGSRIKVIRQFDSRPWLQQLCMPLLLLVGQYDRPPFLSASQMINRSTMDSVLEVVEETGHFPHIERHDLVNLYIDDFIGQRLSSLVD